MKKRKSPFKKQQLPTLNFLTDNGESITSDQNVSRQRDTVEDNEEINVIEGSPLSDSDRHVNRISRKDKTERILKDKGVSEEEMSGSRKRVYSSGNSKKNEDKTGSKKRDDEIGGGKNDNSQDLFNDEVSTKRLKLSYLSKDDKRKECDDKSDNSKINSSNKLAELTRSKITSKKHINGHRISFYCPKDSSPNSYSLVIRDHMDKYFTVLAETQTKLPRVDWGDAVLPGRHHKDTIELLRPGERQVDIRRLTRSPSPMSGDETEVNTSASKNNKSVSQITLFSEGEDNDKNGDDESETEFEVADERKSQRDNDPVKPKRLFPNLKRKLMSSQTPPSSGSRHLSRNVDGNGFVKDKVAENVKETKEFRPRSSFYKSSEASGSSSFRSGKSPWQIVEIDVPTKYKQEDKQMLDDLTSCPICNKNFPKSKIETHASTCGTSDDELEEPALDLIPRKDTYQCLKCGQKIVIARRTRHIAECPGVDDDDDDFDKLKKTPSYNTRKSASSRSRWSNNVSMI